MKKSLFMIAAAIAALMIIGCEKKSPTGSDNGGQSSAKLEAELTVTDIADNCATISVKVTSGISTKAYIIKSMTYEDVTVDPTKEIQFINYIQTNGVEVSLPYTEKLTDLTVGKDLFTAVAVCDASGRPALAKYQVWTPEGQVAGWSTDNNPGSLDEVIWK